MPSLRVHNLTISADGYVAGPDQSLERPMGRGTENLHAWMMKTRFGAAIMGRPGEGETGVDDDIASRFGEGVGAFIMGRNMFGPVRGPWPTDRTDPLADWRGWWGENPPYHCGVFVLTHYPRPSLTMDGGNVFHFTDDPIEDVLARAFETADGRDVQLGGGASTVRQFLRAGLVDELNVVISPVVLGGGERLFEDGVTDGYEVVDSVVSPNVLHLRLARVGDGSAR